MKKLNAFLVLTAVLFMFPLTTAFAQVQLSFGEQLFDFGYVGIDYLFKHKYRIPNVGDTPVRLTKIDIDCECTTARIQDSVIAPGDTGIVEIQFNTKDAFGPTNKMIKVHTDNPKTPEFDLYYVSLVGRWYNGLKPNPIGMFFLKGKTSLNFEILSSVNDHAEVDSVRNEDSLFTVKVVTSKAKKGEKLVLEVSPNPHLEKGTYHGNFSMYLHLEGNEGTVPAILTTPVKIVLF